MRLWVSMDSGAGFGNVSGGGWRLGDVTVSEDSSETGAIRLGSIWQRIAPCMIRKFRVTRG